MSEIKLLPCPFCSGEAEYSEHYEDNGGVEVYYREYHYYIVSCDKCGLTFVSRIGKNDVIKRWNTRKPMERILERLKEYRNFKDHDSLDRQCIDGAINIVNEEGGIE